MRHADGHCALSYNVQISTDAGNGIAVSMRVGQAAPDYEYLAPAVAQIKSRLGQAPEQIVVDAGYTSRQNILTTHDQNIELVGPGLKRMGASDSVLPRPVSAMTFCPTSSNTMRLAMFTSVRKASASPQAKIGSCARVEPSCVTRQNKRIVLPVPAENNAAPATDAMDARSS